jgi:hypothetical protein
VPPDDLIPLVAQADVGLVGVENRCLSYYLSLPNKFFECLTACIPVITPDFPEMRRALETGNCGWTCSGNTDQILSLILSLSPEAIASKKLGARAVAAGLSWEKEERTLIQMYLRLLPASQATSPVAYGLRPSVPL